MKYTVRHPREDIKETRQGKRKSNEIWLISSIKTKITLHPYLERSGLICSCCRTEYFSF